MGAPETHHRHPKDGSRPIGRWLRARTEEAPTGDFVLRGQRQPGREVLLGRPAGHVKADLRDQLERGVRRNPVDLREVDAAREVLEGGADLEARFVVARLPDDPRRWQRRDLCRHLGDQRADVRLDREIARGQLRLTRIEEFQILLPDEEMLGPIVAREGRDELGLGGTTAMVAMVGEMFGVALARHDVTQDAQPGHAGDIADDHGPLQVHLDEGFRHPLDIGAGAVDERLPMTEIGAEGNEGGGRPKTAAPEPDAVQLPDPLAIRDIAFPPGHVLERWRALTSRTSKPRASRMS